MKKKVKVLQGHKIPYLNLDEVPKGKMDQAIDCLLKQAAFHSLARRRAKLRLKKESK